MGWLFEAAFLVTANAMMLAVTALIYVQHRARNMWATGRWSLAPDDDSAQRTDRVTVVLPARNEAATLAATVEMLTNQTADTERTELVIVVDDASTDETLEVARGLCGDASLVIRPSLARASGGRGPVIGKGVQVAMESGADVISILHADCRPPAKYDDLLRESLRPKGTMMCAFTYTFSEPAEPVMGLRLHQRCAQVRSGYFWMPFGDQMQSMRASTLRQLGGLKTWPILEDLDLAARVRTACMREGGRVDVLPQPVLNSPRRFIKIGVARNIVRNQKLIMKHNAGVPPDEIYRLYYGSSAKKTS